MREVLWKVSQSPNCSLTHTTHTSRNTQTRIFTISKCSTKGDSYPATYSKKRHTNSLNHAFISIYTFISFPFSFPLQSVLNFNAQFHFAASLEQKTISCPQTSHGHEMKMTLIGCCKRYELKGNVSFWLVRHISLLMQEIGRKNKNKILTTTFHDSGRFSEGPSVR